MNALTTKSDQAKKIPNIIGAVTTYTGTTHKWAKGLKVRIVAVHKGYFKPGIDIDDDSQCPFLNDNESLARHGGVGPHDLIEFAPWVKEQGRYSFATSDAQVSEIEMFAHIKN